MTLDTVSRAADLQENSMTTSAENQFTTIRSDASAEPVPLWQSLLERDFVPDWIVRRGIRSLLRRRLNEQSAPSEEVQVSRHLELIRELRRGPIAIHTAEANEQHYEVPSRFFELVLGGALKYSCAYYDEETSSLSDAERRMLELTVSRAQLTDGQQILELGCGWGSLTLHMASRFRNARIVAVSNSASQCAYVMEQAASRGLTNVEVVTADMNEFDTDELFDRVVSVEMFEHMRNYARLLEKISGWLVPEGKLFVHVFSHVRFAYPFEIRDESDWMARYFFTGGVMPSDDLLLHFQDHLAIRDRWRIDGTHYQRTAEDWLRNVDANREEILSIFAEVYGRNHALRWLVRWRIFFMACAELFGHESGRQWIVSHYLFHRH